LPDRRIRVGVFMGGASAEREISLASGQMIAEHLPRERYEVVMLDPLALMARHPELTPELRQKADRLLSGTAEREVFAERDLSLPSGLRDQIQSAAVSVVAATTALGPGAGRPVDVAFLALHGRFGEDGTIQGTLDLLGVPYVGSGTLASALAMDKVMAKKVLCADGVPVARGLVVDRAAFRANPAGESERAAFAFLPAVTKPARQGSSIGMSLVESALEMRAALDKAFAHDARVLVEERLVGTELTVGVLGNGKVEALPVVEIVPKNRFFDYEAKYDPDLSEEICPARISEDDAARAQDLALRSHRALGCRGLSRVDMVLTAQGPVVLEVNTMPGMTVNSLLPKAAKAAGIPFPELLDRLVRLALEPEA
jgi:D-alanine-D-alanine ligase